jgi:hypothetical protein
MPRSTPLLLLVAAASLGCPPKSDDPGPALGPMKTAEVEDPPETPPTPKVDLPAEPEVPDGEPGPLRVSAQAETLIQLHPLLSGELYMSVGPKLVRLAVDGRHRADPSMLRGIVSFREPGPEAFAEVTAWQPVAVGGRFPDGLYLALQATTGYPREREVPDLYQWDDAHERWAPVNNRSPGYAWLPGEFHPWIDHSILCDRTFRPHYSGQEAWDGPSDGPSRQDKKQSARAIEAAKRLIVVRGRPKAPVFADAINQKVVAFDSLGTGEILAALADGTVMQWAPSAEGDTEPTVEPLPSAEGGRVDPIGVRLHSPGRALVFGGERTGAAIAPYLATVDGGAWHREQTFTCAHPIVAYAQVEGQQWAICGARKGTDAPAKGQAIWTAPPLEPWETLPLPTDSGAPRDVVAKRRNHVWIVTQRPGEAGSQLLHNGRVEGIVDYPGIADLADELLQWTEPLSESQECSNIFATLHDDGVDLEAIGRTFAGKYPDAGRFTQLSLVRTTFRGKTTAGLQLWAVESIPERTKILAKLEKVTGSAALGTPYCYYAEGTALQKWSLGSEREE